MIVDYANVKGLNQGQFYEEVTNKKQIVLHHTVSDAKSEVGDIAWWNSNAERVGAHFIITSDGRVTQTIDTKFWIHHLGISLPGNKVESKHKLTNVIRNQQSIGIELDSAGGLTRVNGVWRSSFGTTIADDRVEVYPLGYGGYHGFEKYSDGQLLSCRRLLETLCVFYKIPLKCAVSEWRAIFDICNSALIGVPGIYTHTSYRTDKSDCHPSVGLMKMLEASVAVP